MARLVIFWLKVLAAAVSAGLTVTTAAHALKLWTVDARTIFVIAFVAAVLALVAATSAAWSDLRGMKRHDRDTHVDVHIAAAFWTIYDATYRRISPKDLGIAVYTIGWDRPRWRKTQLGVPVPYWKGKRLKGLRRQRPRHHNESTGIVWRPNKGVIGTCVGTGSVAYVDVGASWAPYLACDEGTWRALPATVSQGLSYAEFRSLVDGGKRLGVVVASPILRPGKGVVGCIAVDGPSGLLPLKVLNSQPVKDALSNAALAIERVV